jgi:putative DNA primase/helicase
VTQAWTSPRTIEPRQGVVDQIHAEVFEVRSARRAKVYINGTHPVAHADGVALDDLKLIEAAHAAANNGLRFSRLYHNADWEGAAFPSKSEADLWFCSRLAFWSQRDRAQMERLLRASAMWSDKFERADYLKATLDKAIAECTDTYRSNGNSAQHTESGDAGTMGKVTSNTNHGHGKQSEEANEETSDDEFQEGGGDDPVAITLEPGRKPEILDAAEKILVEHAPRLKVFQRSGEVVRIIALTQAQVGRAKKRDKIERQPGTIALLPVEPLALCEIWDRTITWRKWSRDGKNLVAANFPLNLAQTYLARRQYDLPHLSGVIEAPIVRDDGTILCSPGYDPETELFLHSNDDWSSLRTLTPTPEDAVLAAGALLKPFNQFPFITPAARAVLLAGILTALQRRRLRSAPLITFSAPTQRSGKSMLADAIAILATGREAPAMTFADEPPELRKAITSVLLEGYLITHFDNITKPLDSPDLAKAITQLEYRDRLLGANRTTILPTNMLWIGTGNNLVSKGDLTSRVLEGRINAGMEHPETRSFEIENLPHYLREHRVELVTAALTILRAYHLAGAPKQDVDNWGGFDEWSRQIREPIVWLIEIADELHLAEHPALDDPCRTREAVLVKDPEREADAEVLHEWHAAFGEGERTTREIIDAAASRSSLNQALLVVACDRNGRDLNSRRFGHWCAHMENRIVNGLQLVRTGESHSATKWTVVRVEQ